MKKCHRLLIIQLLLCLSVLNSSCGKNIFQRTNADDVDGETAKTGILKRFERSSSKTEKILNKDGSIIEERFKVPEGFERVEVQKDSFGEFLRTIKLRPDGTKVKYYDGKEKPGDVYDAVLDIDVGDRDLQQCADAVMRLRGEYLYKRGLYDKIAFHFVSGFLADYSTWMKGNRINVEGNNAYWVKKTDYSNEYSSFRQYMDMVFAYAGTVSLEKELKSVAVEDMKIGDVFIKGSLPGHSVIVVDMAENKKTGEKLFMLAQSYMPAQDIHILKATQNEGLSPWYSTGFGDTLKTPEWQFSKEQLRRFMD